MTRHVRVDIHFTGDRLPVSEVMRLSRLAEHARLGCIWHAEAFHDSLVSLAAIAGITRDIRLGSNITQWTRTLPNLEIAAGDLQEICGGRFTLGLGTGVREWNEDWHGIAFDRPLRRMREYVQGLRVLWTAGVDNPVGFDGEIFRVRNYVRFNGPMPNPPPVHVAASLSGMARVAGAVADGVNFNAVHSTAWLREVLLPAVADGARSVGRRVEDLALGVLLITAVAGTRAEAFRLARHQVAYFLGVAPYFEPVLKLHGFDTDYARIRTLFAAGDTAAAIEAISDDMVETFTLSGTPDEVRRKVARYDGLLDFVMMFAPSFGLDRAQTIANHESMIAAFAA